MTGLYRIAGCVIEIRSIYPEVHHLCRDYRAEGLPHFTVEITGADIEAERTRPGNEIHTDGGLEMLAVYRKIAERMLDYDTLLMHGSCVAVDGIGYLFTAKSGTGKSTHTALWRQHFGARARMVNDDKPLIRVGAAGAVICGTPWNGKHGLGENIEVPLRAICLLHRAGENHIESVTAKDALPLLLQQIYRPADPAGMLKMLTLTDRLLGQVGLYRLGCNRTPDAARIASEGIMK